MTIPNPNVAAALAEAYRSQEAPFNPQPIEDLRNWIERRIQAHAEDEHAVYPERFALALGKGPMHCSEDRTATGRARKLVRILEALCTASTMREEDLTFLRIVLTDWNGRFRHSATA